MGGIVAFEWREHQMTLLQNRDNWETRVINAAAWDGGILGGRCEVSNGTWFGVTEGGRVAFLVDTALMVNMADDNGDATELIPIDFLKSNLSPQMFAERLARDEEEFHENFDEEDGDETGRAYNLIVADITSRSMVYISKPSSVESVVNRQQVAFGVHTLSLQGLDSQSPKDLHLRGLFNERIGQYENQQLPPMNELAARFMYDPTEAVPGDELTALFVQTMSNLPSSELETERYGTTSTTAFVVNPTNQVMFYERYLENGEWNDHDFTFNIAA